MPSQTSSRCVAWSWDPIFLSSYIGSAISQTTVDGSGHVLTRPPCEQWKNLRWTRPLLLSRRRPLRRKRLGIYNRPASHRWSRRGSLHHNRQGVRLDLYMGRHRTLAAPLKSEWNAVVWHRGKNQICRSMPRTLHLTKIKRRAMLLSIEHSHALSKWGFVLTCHGHTFLRSGKTKS